MGDLREWIETMDTQGELRTVRGVDWDVELGVIVDQYQRRMNLPALLLDEIKGHSKGFRVLANTLTSTKRIALTLGLPPETATGQPSPLAQYFSMIKRPCLPGEIYRPAVFLSWTATR